MQQKSDRKLHPAFFRVTALKNTNDWTWEQVAKALDLSVGMLMMVKSGKRGFSDRALYRLQLSERQAGIALPAGELIKIPIARMNAADAAAALANPFEPPPSDARKRKKIAERLRALADELDPPQ